MILNIPDLVIEIFLIQVNQGDKTPWSFNQLTLNTLEGNFTIIKKEFFRLVIKVASNIIVEFTTKLSFEFPDKFNKS